MNWNLRPTGILMTLFVMVLLSMSCSNSEESNFLTEGTLIVLNKLADTAMIFDLKTGKMEAELATGKEPHEVVVTSDGERAIITNYSDGSLTVIDIPNKKTIKTIQLSEHQKPHGIVILDQENRVLVTSERQQSILVIDINEGVILKEIKTNQDKSHMVIFHKERSLAFVSNLGSGSVNVIDMEIGESIKIIETGKGAEGMDFTSDGKQLWVGNRNENTISIIDLEKLEVIDTLGTAEFPIRIKAVQGTGNMLVNCAKAREMQAFDIDIKTAHTSISFKKNALEEFTSHTANPVGLLVHPNGNYGFVATTNGNSIEVIDLKKWKVVASLSTGEHPDGLAYSKHNF